MTLQIIGAGFGRTGTSSLKLALEQLGFSKCHHMREVFPSRFQTEAWHARSRGGTANWEAVFDGYAAACDWPSSAYWEELYRHYPESKVVLTVRDEERWYQSTAETIYPISTSFPWWLRRLSSRARLLAEMIDATVWSGIFDGRFEDKDHALRVYRENSERVKEIVAPERLLVFEAREGWEPLCAFLGVPVPEGPYPHVNEAAPMKRVVIALRILRWLPALLIALLVAGLWPSTSG
jgi:hypothetical protein